VAHATWQVDSTPPFQYFRFDSAFVPGQAPWGNKVYFLGGRTDPVTESPDIWSFDPLTGTYSDTGDDMIEDVSNYFANLVMDDGTGRGPAIYVIGGYDSDNAGNHIGTVQRYYPQSGTVEALPPADNWTATIGGLPCQPGGAAVVNDVIYVFGGWNASASPYFGNETYAFDPKQTSGSRWSNLGITLGTSRGYIQVAVRGTKIYAMGGHAQYTYPPTTLYATDVVEVLDTCNIAGGWTSLAPMPVATAEGRGFSWNGRLYIVGGGGWPNSTAEVLEYDPHTNTWDQSFPALNQARRNHAGALVTLNTPDPDDGLPGMWVFGGRTVSDYPPYGDTEYYPLIAMERPVPSITGWGIMAVTAVLGLIGVFGIQRRRNG
jgi:hypothetical protein